MGEHDTEIAVQESELGRVKQDVQKLTESLAGLPYVVNNLEQRVSELCNLIKRMQDIYQTKEMCTTISAGCKNVQTERYEDMQREMEEVKGDFRHLLWGTMTCVIYVAWELIKTLPSLIIR